MYVFKCIYIGHQWNYYYRLFHLKTCPIIPIHVMYIFHTWQILMFYLFFNRMPSALHIRKSILNIVKSNQIWIVITLFLVMEPNWKQSCTKQKSKECWCSPGWFGLTDFGLDFAVWVISLFNFETFIKHISVTCYTKNQI